jgi:hypothetical protein
MSVQAVMGANARELGTVASQGHDEGTGAAADVGGRPNSDESAVLGILDPAGTDKNVTHVPPEAHFDATDPRGCGVGVWRVSATGEAEDAPAVAYVEDIDVERILSGAVAAPDVPPLLFVPLQECDVLTCAR